MNKAAMLMLLSWVAVSGCGLQDRRQEGRYEPDREPLALQQARAYPETVTGRFVSLVDFEGAGSGPRGFEQIGLFSIRPDRPEGERRFVVNVTRTGSGAMEVNLPAGSQLVFTVPDYRDFTGYSLVSFALHSETLRDDLCVTLTTGSVAWTSHRTLVLPGWNTVLIDIQRLQSLESFDITNVGEIALSFADAAGPVRFNIDDIMLVDNARQLRPVPKGVTLYKAGLDYKIVLPHRPRPLLLTQHGDGLWRFDGGQITVQLAPPGVVLPPGGERLELMGPRRIGRVEVVETNPIRVRLTNTWYFPSRAGEWVSLGVRQIRWEHTFYGDGRWVTHVEVNNSGGRQIAVLRMWLDEDGVWSEGAVSRDLLVREFAGPIGRWGFLRAPNGLQKQTLQKNHSASGSVETTIADGDAFAGGDFDRDRFDESRGCYFLKSVKGHCRFRIVPPAEGLLNPVFHIAGPWVDRVSVNGQGLAIRNVVRLADGSVLFAVPGWVRRRMAVEVVGREAPTVEPTAALGK